MNFYLKSTVVRRSLKFSYTSTSNKDDHCCRDTLILLLAPSTVTSSKYCISYYCTEQAYRQLPTIPGMLTAQFIHCQSQCLLFFDSHYT